MEVEIHAVATPPPAMQSSLGAQGEILSWSKAENTYIVMPTCQCSLPSDTDNRSSQIAGNFFSFGAYGQKRN